MKVFIAAATIQFIIVRSAVASVEPCPAITKWLTLGAQDAQVISLKRFLTAEGLLSNVRFTTYFGISTQTALRAWQKKAGIVASGTATTTGFGATGPRTRAALSTCRFSTASPTHTIPPASSPAASTTSTPSSPPAPSPTGTPGSSPRAAAPGGGSAAAPPCTPRTETRTRACILKSGSIVEQRSSSCPDAIWSDWVEASRTCAEPALTYTWKVADWNTCTNARQKRSVSCTVAGGQAVAADLCSAPAPAAEQTCAIDPPHKPCAFNGKTVADGSEVLAYKEASVAPAGTCTSEARRCSDGTLSGSAPFASCLVVKGCSVAQDETRTIACPTGESGSIVQVRKQTCASASAEPVWSDWVSDISTCFAPSTRSGSDIWLSPNLSAEGYLDLFKAPSTWASARSAVTVFKFHGANMNDEDTPNIGCGGLCNNNVFPAFKDVGAFQLLKVWKIRTAVETGVYKKIDGWADSCRLDPWQTGLVDIARKITRAGGSLNIVALDEPIFERKRCGFTDQHAAELTADYIKFLRARLPGVSVALIEPYPEESVETLLKVVDSLRSLGARPDALHLDIDRERLALEGGFTVNAGRFADDMHALGTGLTE